jgi:putative membrane protein
MHLLASLDVQSKLIEPVVTTLVIGIVAITLLFVSVYLMERLSPFSLRKEIEEDQNTSAAIVMGAIVIGVSMVIAAVARG